MFGFRRRKHVKYFVAIVLTVFDEPFCEFKFERTKSKVDNDWASIFYLLVEMYVELNINVHPRDWPENYNIVLGEGTLEIPESSWNSIALWRLRQSKGDVAATWYELKNYPSVRDALVAMREDLFTHATDFLSGDLKAFRHTRAVQTREREPYKIHEPVSFGFGKYKVRYDPESVKLKEKYSKE